MTENEEGLTVVGFIALCGVIMLAMASANDPIVLDVPSAIDGDDWLDYPLRFRTDPDCPDYSYGSEHWKNHYNRYHSRKADLLLKVNDRFDPLCRDNCTHRCNPHNCVVEYSRTK